MYGYLDCAWLDTLVRNQRHLRATRLLHIFWCLLAVILVSVLSYSHIDHHIGIIYCNDRLTSPKAKLLCYTFSHGDGPVEQYLRYAYL